MKFPRSTFVQKKAVYTLRGETCCIRGGGQLWRTEFIVLLSLPSNAGLLLNSKPHDSCVRSTCINISANSLYTPYGGKKLLYDGILFQILKF